MSWRAYQAEAIFASQKKDMMSFIKEDGKGFVGIHAGLDTNYIWPEYGEMVGLSACIREV